MAKYKSLSLCWRVVRQERRLLRVAQAAMNLLRISETVLTQGNMTMDYGEPIKTTQINKIKYLIQLCGYAQTPSDKKFFFGVTASVTGGGYYSLKHSKGGRHDRFFNHCRGLSENRNRI
jgi:hypothetical protein